MKNLLILMVAIVAITFTSCEDNENVTFDTANGQTLAAFNKEFSNLEVVVDATGSVEIEIGVTTLSNSARTVMVSLNEDESTADTANYSFASTTVTIPANEFIGTLIINGIDNSVETTATKIVVDLVSVEGGTLADQKTKHEVSLFQVCPVDETLFTGMYLIEQTTPFLFGSTFSDGTIVELTANGFDRTFMTANFPDFCGEIVPFTFTLNCNKILVPSQKSTCFCNDGTGWFDTAVVPASYDATNDSSFVLTFTDDAQSDCVPGTPQTSYTFTKQ